MTGRYSILQALRTQARILVPPGFILLLIVLLGSLFFTQSRSVMESHLKEGLQAAAALGAMQFDAKDLEAIQEPADLETEEFRKVARILEEIQSATPHALFVYIMRRTSDPLTLEFVAEADMLEEEIDANGNGNIDPDEEITEPGLSYDISALPVMQREAFLHPAVDQEVTRDQWGSYISGYAPIRDSNGEAVAILGIDMDAADFLRLSQGVFSPFMLLLFMLAGTIVAGYIGLLAWKRRLEVSAARKLQRWNESLEERVRERTKDLEDTQRANMNILEDLQKAKTALEREAQNTKKFQQAVEASKDAIAIASPTLQFLYVNPAWTETTGYPEEEIIGTTPNMFLSASVNPGVYEQMVAAANRGESFQSEEFQFVRRDGEAYDVEVNMYPVQEKGHTRFYVILQQDITERRRADSAKSSFLSAASHQLRTPLTGIRWSLHTLQTAQESKLNDFQSEVVEDAIMYVMRMIETVHTMLHISDLEAGRIDLHVTTISLRDLFEDVLQVHRKEYEQKRQTCVLECSDTLTAHTDPELLSEILSCLIDNAIHYTPEGGTVTVRAEKEDRSLRISVADTGYGIPIYQRRKVFTKFFRGDNVITKHTNGTGLGLYMVHALIGLIGGTIKFVSTENKGTTFSITLPGL